MGSPSWLVESDGRILLRLRVQPRARSDEIIGPEGDRLKVRVTAAPVEDAANRAVVAMLARAFRCPKSEVILVSGRTSKNKTVAVTNFRARPDWLRGDPAQR